MPKSSTSWGPGQSGNKGGRPKQIERLTREEIESFTWDFGGDIGVLNGWQALRRRAWEIAMTAEPKDAIRYIQWIDARAHGQPKQEVEVGEAKEREVDWSAIPVERRKHILSVLAELDAYTAEPDGSVEH